MHGCFLYVILGSSLAYIRHSHINYVTYQTELFGNKGTTVRNLLHSYRFQRAIFDRMSKIPKGSADYSKPEGYETVRYPFTGLVGTGDVEATKQHNQRMKDLGEEKTNNILQSNVSTWLIGTVTSSDGTSPGGYTRDAYIQSLSAPNYTVYSNTTSAQRWNDDRFQKSDVGYQAPSSNAVMPIESPHNSIHLAVGGFDLPGFNADSISDSNGDMGENETAGFDPIFFFHHCFIDLMFWSWQVHNQKTDELNVISKYAGTNSFNNQGPTPGILGGSWLDLDTPLNPFTTRTLPKHEGILGGNVDASDTADKPLTSNVSCPLLFVFRDIP